MDVDRGVIVATGKLEASEKIKNILIEGGYDVLTICKSGNEVIRKALQYSPGLVILSYKLPDTTAMDVYNSLIGTCDFLVMINESYLSIVDESLDVFYLTNPLSRSVLLNSVNMVFQSRKKLFKLQEKVEKLEVKIEERKIVDKAKGILMSAEGITEMEAFRIIQKRSMDSGKKMIKVAEEIINSKVLA